MSVLFLDFGSQKEVECDELYTIDSSLPELFCTAEQMSFKCRLADVLPIAEMVNFAWISLF